MTPNQYNKWLQLQWQTLANYVIKLDTGNGQIFSIAFATLGIFTIFGFSEAQDNNLKENPLLILGLCLSFIMIPSAIMILLFYEQYRLRRVAALKGYLALIEKELRRNNYNQIGSWYYAYEQSFITQENRANKYMCIPVLMGFSIVHAVCVYGFNAINYKGNSTTLQIILEHKALINVYFAVVILLDILVVIAILLNGPVHYKILDKTQHEVIKYAERKKQLLKYLCY